MNGLTIGLLAVGLVLVFKANRFVNFAHGQFGALPALLLARVVLDFGVPFWVAFPAAAAIGAGTAVGVERFIIRPVRAKSRSPLRLLLLAVGVSQVLIALAFVPSFAPDPSQPRPYPQPFDLQLRVGGVVLDGMSVLTFVLVPLLVGGLALFLRSSSLGKQIRAAANNPDSARLCGVSVDKVSAVTWAIAGALSAISAVLVAPTQPSLQAASLGPALLLVTLGAAAFGAFVSIPAALLGGLALGLCSQVVTGITSSSNDGQLATFILILIAVTVRGRQLGKVFSQSGGAAAELPVTRIPPAIRQLPIVTHARRIVAAVALLIAVAAPSLPSMGTEGQRFKLVLLVVFALVGVSLTMLVGWAGQISLGHGAIVGIAAFLTARLTPEGYTVPALVLIAGLTGAAVLVVTGLPAVRVPGFTLAVATLGVAVVTPAWLFRQEWFGTASPNSVTFDDPLLTRGLGALHDQRSVYYFGLILLVLAMSAGRALRSSVPGRLVLAVRDNERAVGSLGIAPASVKLAILGVSGFFAGSAGVLWASAWRLGNADHFRPDFSLAVLAIPVVGGLGSLGGAVAGALLLYVPGYFITPKLGFLGEFGKGAGFLLLSAGVAQVVTIRAFPAGLAGVAQARWQRWLNAKAAAVGSSTVEELDVDDQPVPSIAPTAAFDNPGPALPIGPSRFEARMARVLGNGHGEEPSAGEPLVVEGARLSFGGIKALNGASIKVRPGEIVGLIGPNGAGKTTLMNVVSGVVRIDEGSVKVFGHEVTGLASDLRAGFGIGRTFQDASLFAGLTVRETIQVAVSRRWMVRFTWALLGAPWSRYAEQETYEEAERILRRFGLLPWADSQCGELSTGTRRICDLACQVASAPAVLLLDEPTGGVAQREAEAFGPLLRRIRDELGCSIVIVEHDMPLLMGLCDRVYAMDAGAVIAEGTPSEVRDNPQVVATYLGTDDVAIERSGAKLVGSDA